ncbi:protein still life, isoform SIF type 1-like [Branchiostoma floridae]|uniref:Protein still life, isoform SIF type 1-like n=1 Tax=Branchiostoma floridae TaxID=7739 RepID=A0A9J7LPN5_BRAFL|nr:protein still life, isoform SIF type 1-like [Branchiostoma floridae]
MGNSFHVSKIGSNLSCATSALLPGGRAGLYRVAWMKNRHGKPDDELRLLAEVYRVSSNNSPPRWKRVTDTLVPVTVKCLQDAPFHVFHITANNFADQRVLDVQITVPGTLFNKTAESFVQWRDKMNGGAWGLNFVSENDAFRFLDACMPTGRNTLSPVSNCSSSSLRITPPKKYGPTESGTDLRPPVNSRNTSSSSSSRTSCSEYEGVDSEGSSNYENVSREIDEEAAGKENMRTSRKDSDVKGMTKCQEERAASERRHRSHSCDGQSIALETRIKRYLYMEDAGDATESCSAQSMTITSFPVNKICNQSGSTIQSSATPTSSPSKASANTSVNASPMSVCSVSSARSAKISDGSKKLVSRQTSAPSAVGHHKPPPQSFPHSLSKASTAQNSSFTISTPDSSSFSDSRGLSSPPSSPMVVDSNPSTPCKSESLSPRRLFVKQRSAPCNLGAKLYSQGRRTSIGSITEEYLSQNAHSIDEEGEDPAYDNVDPRENGSRRGSLYENQNFAAPLLPPADFQENDSIFREYEFQMKRHGSERSDSGFEGGYPELDNISSSRSGNSGNSTTSTHMKQFLASLPSSSESGSHGTSSDSSSVGIHGDVGKLRMKDPRCSVSDESMMEDVRHSKLMRGYESNEEDRSINESEEEEESDLHSPSRSHKAYNRQGGSIRKTGWLHVKNFLEHKKKKVELSNKRRWRKFWVCLKGTLLLFFECDERQPVDENSEPTQTLFVEGSIAQAVPEHPKRENIFCLSNGFGDAYLFQAYTQIEMENWITAIHSACSSAIARQHGKDDTLKLLRAEAQKLEEKVDADTKMKKMGELQMAVVPDPKSREAITKQIIQWEQNLEKVQLELYRYRCYMASLQGTELPNPKTLLACASKPTKAALARLGHFSVSSFHALICARAPVNASVTPCTHVKKKKGLLSTLRGSDSKKKIRTPTREPKGPNSVFGTPSSSVCDVRETDLSKGADSPRSTSESGIADVSGPTTPSGALLLDRLGVRCIRVLLPNDHVTMVTVQSWMTVQDVLTIACLKRGVDPRDHFLQLKQYGPDGMELVTPDRKILMDNLVFEEVVVSPKCIYQVELTREPTGSFGFRVDAELGADGEMEDELRVFVSAVERGGLAHQKDVLAGDEVLVINGRVVYDLDMIYIESLLQGPALTLTLRTNRPESQVASLHLRTTDMLIDQLICPPPPSQSEYEDPTLDDLIIPAPTDFDFSPRSDSPRSSVVSVTSPLQDQSPWQQSPRRQSRQDVDSLLQRAEEVTDLCRSHHNSGNTSPRRFSVSKELSNCQKLRKVILELVTTEKTYVKDMECLLDRYLHPLQNESFLSPDELEALFGNIEELVQFQRKFLQALEDSVSIEPDFHTVDSPTKFRKTLFSISGAFLYYVDHFKLYSAFCASHSKAIKVLDPGKGNAAFRAFLEARNPKHQHSATLESYLIKPIQRIMKYPLLLKQLAALTNQESDEHFHLSEALKGMTSVAEHINEMQRLFEEYGGIFDVLIRDQPYAKKEVSHLRMGDLQLFANALWLNSSDDIKHKKGTEPEMAIFVFKGAVVLVCKEDQRHKWKLTLTRKQGREVLEDREREVVLFKRMVPVSQLQIRNSNTNDTYGRCVWELVHSKSHKEGRPEKVFQFCNSTPEAKNGFMKVIRQVIKEAASRCSSVTPKSLLRMKRMEGTRRLMDRKRRHTVAVNEVAGVTLPGALGGVDFGSNPSNSSEPRNANRLHQRRSSEHCVETYDNLQDRDRPVTFHESLGNDSHRGNMQRDHGVACRTLNFDQSSGMLTGRALDYVVDSDTEDPTVVRAYLPIASSRAGLEEWNDFATTDC